MILNTKNTSASEDLGAEFAKQVSKITGIKQQQFEQEVAEKGEKKAILDLLRDQNNNEKLGLLAVEKDWKFIEAIDLKNRTTAIVKAALAQDVVSLKFASEDMQSRKDVAEVYITGLIKAGKSFLEVQRYLDTHFDGNKHYESLIDHYLKMQKLSATLARQDLTQYLVAIRDGEFYKQLKSRRIIVGIGSYLKPHKDIFKQFIGAAEELSMMSEDESKRSEVFFEILRQIIGIDIAKLSEQEMQVYHKMLEICIAEYYKKYNPKKEQKPELSLQDDGDDSYNSPEDFEDYSPEEKLDYCYPSYDYSISPSGNYELSLGENRHLDISATEMKRASVAALENYAIFYHTLCDLHLNFIWDKYRSGFTTLCRERFGFHVFEDEGITEYKMMRVLNLIGKNIGIPGSDFDDPENPDEKQVACFEDMSFARRAFRDIQATGKINDEVVDNSPGASSITVIQKYLQMQGLIETDGRFHMNEWK